MGLKPTKAEPDSGKLKIAMYGDAGSGKTFTALTLAEFLVAQEKHGRICFIDTEATGTSAYAMDVEQRLIHPKKFDFDRIKTREIMAVKDFLNPKFDGDKFDPKKWSVLVIDSMSHLWDAANELWTGKKTSQGQNPIHAYNTIKKVFRQMLDNALNQDVHVIICGRKQNEFERHDSDNWEFKGTRMRAERETGYEPMITLKMEQERSDEGREFKIRMFVEKDRTGMYQGKVIYWPKADDFKPWYDLFKGVKTVPMQTSDEAAIADIAAQAAEEENKKNERNAIYGQIRELMLRADSIDELKVAWSMTQGKKGKIGDDAYEALEAVKDAEKARIMQRGGAKAVSHEPAEKVQ